MQEDIEITAGQPQARVLVPMRVGSAVVYVERLDDQPVIIESGDIRAVAPLSPTEIFENAAGVIREGVRVLGETLEMLARASRPCKITAEFSLSFEVEGKVSIVPVLLTGKSNVHSGLKVTAEWQLGRPGNAV
jgi:hypothetical protein